MTSFTFWIRPILQQIASVYFVPEAVENLQLFKYTEYLTDEGLKLLENYDLITTIILVKRNLISDI